MRIVFLNNFNYLRGGSERVLLEEMRVLKEAGHEVAVFSRSNPLNEPSEYERFFPPDMGRGNLSISVKALKTVKELVYSGAAKQGIKQTIERFKPDVAHAHNIYGRLSLSVLDALREAQIQTILSLHDYKFLCPSYLMLNHGKVCERCSTGHFFHAFVTRCHKDSYPASAVYAFESWFNHRFGKYGNVSCFISPSRFLRNKAIDFGIAPDRIRHIPNFIDRKGIHAALDKGDYLLFFGRLSHEKGVGTLLTAFNLLRGDAQLMLVGDGPMREELEGITSRAGSHVQFTGYLSGKPLEDAIAGAKVVVMPSEWYENAPLSILEAFAYGKPVLGARIGGIPEMIDDGLNGILFESGNVEDLRHKLELVVGLPDIRIREMGKAAREKVEREFGPELHYERLMAVYKAAIARNGSCV